jgi:hypothetical protein
LTKVVLARWSGSVMSRAASASSRSPDERSSSHPSRMKPRSEYTDSVPGLYSSGSRAAASEMAQRSDAASAACRQNGR